MIKRQIGIVFITATSLLFYSCASYLHTFDGYEIQPIDVHLLDGNIYEDAYILAHNETNVFLSRSPTGDIDRSTEVSRQDIERVLDKTGKDVSKEILRTDYQAKNAHYTEQIHQLMLAVTLASGVIALVTIAAILSANSD